MIAQDPRVVVALNKGNRRDVAQLMTWYLLTKKQSSIVVVVANSQVVTTGEKYRQVWQLSFW